MTEPGDADKPPPTEFPDPERFDYSSFSCPRCSTTMTATTYRPCDACVTQLRASSHRSANTEAPAEVGAYEPKMNVTPNAVALKDD